MRVVIRALPRQPNALGGEDQICFFLQEAFESMGHSVDVVFDKPRGDPADVYLNMGVAEAPVGKKSILWYFNEGMTPDHAMSLKYDVVASNMASPPDGIRKLPLAASKRALSHRGAEIAGSGVAYVGNYSSFSDYKITAINKWLLPLAESLPDQLQIYGGTRWKDHEALAPFYRGILHPDSWPWLRSIARTWVGFRSEGQADLGMMPSRIYDLMAANVGKIVTDGPIEPDASSHVAIVSSPEEMIDACRSTDLTSSACSGSVQILSGATYEHRARQILAWLS